MHPVLFRVPGIGYEVPGYGLALMVGFLLSVMWATHRATKSGANPDVVLNCAFLALFGGVVGARTMYVIHYWPVFAVHGSPGKIFQAVIDVRQGGLEVYGGVLLVVLLVLVYLWRWKHSIRWYLDIMAPSAALGMAIGRVGCLLNGCCWGGVCDLPWAVQFPYASPPAIRQWEERQPGAALPQELLVSGLGPGQTRTRPVQRPALLATDAELADARQKLEAGLQRVKDLEQRRQAVEDPAEKRRLTADITAERKRAAREVPDKLVGAARLMVAHDLSPQALRALAAQHPSLRVHPTQLYSTIALGLVAGLLGALYWRRTRDGQIILLFFIIEPPTRWVLEVLRADNPLDTGGFTISQAIAIAVVLCGIAGLIGLQYCSPRSPYAVRWEPPKEESDKEQAAAAQ
jgi:phosphatidylglycerol:prolipoprotein diacylglycerol transferase